jgi:amino acid transporter
VKLYGNASETQAASYDRNHPRYPYKSHGQWLKAAYGMSACIILVLFNGLKAFLEEPFGTREFISSYISVCTRLIFPNCFLGNLLGRFSNWSQVPVFVLLILGYKIRKHGFRFSQWGPERSNDLRNTVQVTSDTRKGRLEFPDDGFSKENTIILFNWIWVWMK